jgi:hypothetical protein
VGTLHWRLQRRLQRGFQRPSLRESALWVVIVTVLIWYFPAWWLVLLQAFGVITRELLGGG